MPLRNCHRDCNLISVQGRHHMPHGMAMMGACLETAVSHNWLSLGVFEHLPSSGVVSLIWIDTGTVPLHSGDLLVRRVVCAPVRSRFARPQSVREAGRTAVVALMSFISLGTGLCSIGGPRGCGRLVRYQPWGGPSLRTRFKYQKSSKNTPFLISKK